MASSIKETWSGFLNKGWEVASSFSSSLKGLAAYSVFVGASSAIASNLLYQRRCETPEPNCITTPASGHLWWHVPERTECDTPVEDCVESYVPYSLIVPAVALVPHAVRLAAYSIGKMRSCCRGAKDRLSELWDRAGESFKRKAIAPLEYAIHSLVDRIFDVSAISIDNPWADGLPELETSEAFKSRIIKLKTPFDSSDPIVSFVRRFIPDELNEVLIATNCKDPEEAQVFFLGESHGSSACIKLQHNVLSNLGLSGGRVFLEANREDVSFSEYKKLHHLTFSGFHKPYEIDGWDSKNDIELNNYASIHEKLYRESSVLLREVLSHLRKDELQFVDEKFIQEIREKYSVSNFSFLNEEEKRKLEEEWNPQIKEAQSLNNRIKELALYLRRSNSALLKFREKVIPWKSRQESLVSCLEHQLRPGRQFFIAGLSHFFDFENKKLETTLAEGVETKRIKHITIIPQIKAEECVDINTEKEDELDVYKVEILFLLLLKELTTYIDKIV